MQGKSAENRFAILSHGNGGQLEKTIATCEATSQRIGTLLGTGCVLSIASWLQPSPRIAEQFLRTWCTGGVSVVQLENALPHGCQPCKELRMRFVRNKGCCCPARKKYCAVGDKPAENRECDSLALVSYCAIPLKSFRLRKPLRCM